LKDGKLLQKQDKKSLLLRLQSTKETYTKEYGAKQNKETAENTSTIIDSRKVPIAQSTAIFFSAHDCKRVLFQNPKQKSKQAQDMRRSLACNLYPRKTHNSKPGFHKCCKTKKKTEKIYIFELNIVIIIIMPKHTIQSLLDKNQETANTSTIARVSDYHQ
jgi:hypothetical protein